MYLDFNIYSNEEFEKHSILIYKKSELIDNTTSYTLDPQLPCKQCKLIIECPGHTGRIPLYHRIVHPLFVSTLCKEITHICPTCKKYNDSDNKKSTCCKKRIIPSTFGLHKTKINNNDEKVQLNFRRKKENKTYSEYAFTFGNHILSIDEMYEMIYATDFSNYPDLKNKLLNVFIKNNPVLPINISNKKNKKNSQINY